MFIFAITDQELANRREELKNNNPTVAQKSTENRRFHIWSWLFFTIPLVIVFGIIFYKTFCVTNITEIETDASENLAEPEETLTVSNSSNEQSINSDISHDEQNKKTLINENDKIFSGRAIYNTYNNTAYNLYNNKTTNSDE